METPIASILWFVFVLALIPVALWALKRLPIVKGSPNSPTRVVGVTALSGSQRLLTVEVGQGEDRRWIVLGVTPSSITLLHSMAPQAESSAAAMTSGATFAETLKRLRSPQQGKP
jgi:flagellar protein FliO/FliZ